MAYFLDAWEIFSKIVPAIHDVIFMQNIKEGTQYTIYFRESLHNVFAAQDTLYLSFP